MHKKYAQKEEESKRTRCAERRYVHKLQERTQKPLTFRKKTQGSYVHTFQERTQRTLTFRKKTQGSYVHKLQ